MGRAIDTGRFRVSEGLRYLNRHSGFSRGNKCCSRSQGCGTCRNRVLSHAGTVRRVQVPVYPASEFADLEMNCHLSPESLNFIIIAL